MHNRANKWRILKRLSTQEENKVKAPDGSIFLNGKPLSFREITKLRVRMHLWAHTCYVPVGQQLWLKMNTTARSKADRAKVAQNARHNWSDFRKCSAHCRSTALNAVLFHDILRSSGTAPAHLARPFASLWRGSQEQYGVGCSHCATVAMKIGSLRPGIGAPANPTLSLCTQGLCACLDGHTRFKREGGYCSQTRMSGDSQAFCARLVVVRCIYTYATLRRGSSSGTIYT